MSEESVPFEGISKGQLISECLFDVLNFPKQQQKRLMNFWSRIQNWLNWKNKGPFDQVKYPYTVRAPL